MEHSEQKTNSKELSFKMNDKVNGGKSEVKEAFLDVRFDDLRLRSWINYDCTTYIHNHNWWREFSYWREKDIYNDSEWTKYYHITDSPSRQRKVYHLFKDELSFSPVLKSQVPVVRDSFKDTFLRKEKDKSDKIKKISKRKKRIIFCSKHQKSKNIITFENEELASLHFKVQLFLMENFLRISDMRWDWKWYLNNCRKIINWFVFYDYWCADSFEREIVSDPTFSIEYLIVEWRTSWTDNKKIHAELVEVLKDYLNRIYDKFSNESYFDYVVDVLISSGEIIQDDALKQKANDIIMNVKNRITRMRKSIDEVVQKYDVN